MDWSEGWGSKMELRRNIWWWNDVNGLNEGRVVDGSE